MATANGSIASTNKSGKKGAALAGAPGKVKSFDIIILVVTKATELLYII